MRSAASWQPSLVTAALPSSGFSPASSPAPSVQSAGAVTTTRVITYTYDPLGRLVEADYSTGEQFEYAYDAVGNRTAMTDATGVTTYTYDDANRLTSVDGVAYTWDDRGNLVNDGTFTYLYNAAGRMVQAESVTATLVYTYNAQGLRVAQSVNGTETPFVWDWASGLPEMLSGSSNLYLIGHNTLGQSANDDWVYYLPDALGSIRQTTDDAGFVTGSREWTPFGVEVGAAQGGLGYTGEWFDGSAGFTYLRARWYDGSTGQFTQADLSRAEQNLYLYARANPVIFTDPAGTCALQPGGRTCAVRRDGYCYPRHHLHLRPPQPPDRGDLLDG